MDWFGGYQIGIEVLIINGLITFLGLFLISRGKAARETMTTRTVTTPEFPAPGQKG
jgi:hypothetical protein